MYKNPTLKQTKARNKKGVHHFLHMLIYCVVGKPWFKRLTKVVTLWHLYRNIAEGQLLKRAKHQLRVKSGTHPTKIREFKEELLNLNFCDKVKIR